MATWNSLDTKFTLQSSCYGEWLDGTQSSICVYNMLCSVNGVKLSPPPPVLCGVIWDFIWYYTYELCRDIGCIYAIYYVISQIVSNLFYIKDDLCYVE